MRERSVKSGLTIGVGILLGGMALAQSVPEKFVVSGKAAVTIKSGDVTPYNVKLPDGAVRVITTDGAEIWIEPWRAKAFPVIKDLMVDRSAFDRVVQAGAFVSVNTGAPQDANAIPVPKADADRAFDAATCIGCGACVAACKNASAMLFVSAKVSHLNLLPQGKPEKDKRVLAMVHQMDAEGFGACTVTGSCEAVCPKGISLNFIAKMNRDYFGALLRAPAKPKATHSE